MEEVVSKNRFDLNKEEGLKGLIEKIGEIDTWTIVSKFNSGPMRALGVHDNILKGFEGISPKEKIEILESIYKESEWLALGAYLGPNGGDVEAYLDGLLLEPISKNDQFGRGTDFGFDMMALQLKYLLPIGGKLMRDYVKARAGFTINFAKALDRQGVKLV